MEGTAERRGRRERRSEGQRGDGDAAVRLEIAEGMDFAVAAGTERQETRGTVNLGFPRAALAALFGTGGKRSVQTAQEVRIGGRFGRQLHVPAGVHGEEIRIGGGRRNI